MSNRELAPNIRLQNLMDALADSEFETSEEILPQEQTEDTRQLLLKALPAKSRSSGDLLDCQSISPHTWEHARQALEFYFTQRHAAAIAEDLAHETLTAVLCRDLQFESEQDFLRVCYASARNILRSARRAGTQVPSASLGTPAYAETLAPAAVELNDYLNKVLETGKEQLQQQRLVQDSMALEREHLAFGGAEANRNRVRIHRARKKLASIIRIVDR